MQLPAEVIQTDHNLEQVADKASGQLARHRWHWTLDESNAARVSILAYAREVGRNEATIRQYAKGYAAARLADSGTNPELPSNLDRHIAVAKMSTETAAAAEAVASARGTKLGSGRTSAQRQEIRRVREISRQLAEERGTTVEEEAPKVAETIVRHERAEAAEAAAKAEHSDIRFVEMEGYLVKAKRELLKALKIAPVVPWDDESKELLTETVANIKALLGLIDTALSGSSGVDWDAEFAKVAGNENL